MGRHRPASRSREWRTPRDGPAQTQCHYVVLTTTTKDDDHEFSFDSPRRGAGSRYRLLARSCQGISFCRRSSGRLPDRTVKTIWPFYLAMFVALMFATYVLAVSLRVPYTLLK